jgi:hypothetical protein
MDSLKYISTKTLKTFEVLKQQQEEPKCQTSILSLNATDAQSRGSVQTTPHELWRL